MKPIFATKVRVIYWNVQGLKSTVEESRQYLNSFDIVLLSETWIEEKNFAKSQKQLPSGFKWIWTTATRDKHRGRPAGGLLVGIREHF